MAPERVVYVSCDPATLARDVKLLGEQGYQLKRYKVFDLFPRTFHVETVALLGGKKPDDYIDVDLDLSSLKNNAGLSVTYSEIKDFALHHYGVKLSSLEIAQVKRANGLELRKNFNISKKSDQKQPQVTPEKRKLIEEIFYHFGILEQNV